MQKGGEYYHCDLGWLLMNQVLKTMKQNYQSLRIWSTKQMSGENQFSGWTVVWVMMGWVTSHVSFHSVQRYLGGSGTVQLTPYQEVHLFHHGRIHHCGHIRHGRIHHGHSRHGLGLWSPLLLNGRRGHVQTSHPDHHLHLVPKQIYWVYTQPDLWPVSHSQLLRGHRHSLQIDLKFSFHTFTPSSIAATAAATSLPLASVGALLSIAVSSLPTIGTLLPIRALLSIRGLLSIWRRLVPVPWSGFRKIVTVHTRLKTNIWLHQWAEAG